MGVWLFLKYVLQFIATTAFRKGELDVGKRSFNPGKFILVWGVIFGVMFMLYYTYRLSRFQSRVERICPSLTSYVYGSNYDFVIDSKKDLGSKVVICRIQSETKNK